MKIKVICLISNVTFVAGEAFVEQSTDVQRTLALFGGDTIYVNDEYGPSIVRKVIQWADHPEIFRFEHDLVSMMALADELGMDKLFSIGAECVFDGIRGTLEIATGVQQLLDSMAEPIRYRLLDHAAADTFQLLRTSIPPFNHQYQQQLKKLLPNAHHVDALDITAAAKTYETVMQFQRVMKAHVDGGVYPLDALCRSDRSEYSHDCHYLFTLERITHTLRIWDLLHPPFAPVRVWSDVVDAAFEPAGLLFTLGLDGHIRGRTISGSEVVCVACGHADSLSVSKNCLLAFSATPVSLDSQLSGRSTSLWRWTRDGVVRDAAPIEDATTACVSADGTFVVHSRVGVVQTSPVDPAKSTYRRVLEDAKGDAIDELGDVLAHAVSPDNLVVAAVYVYGIKFWWRKEVDTSQYFVLGGTHHDTFGHAAFSPDNRFVALGSWEGDIVLLERRRRSFEVCNRLRFGHAILHLSWSRDGSYLVASSYAGATLVDPHRRSTAHGTDDEP